MAGTDRSPEEKVEALRRRLHEKVEEAIERMGGRSREGGDPYAQDFTGREGRAAEIGREVGALALEVNLVSDPERKAAEESVSWRCPRCGEDSPRARDAAGRPRGEETALKTRVGTLALRLPLFRCERCRKDFSPLPAERQPGAGGL